MATSQWVSFCILPVVHYWCQVWMTSLKYFPIYSWFCDLYSYLNHLWRHQFFKQKLEYLGNERRSFKKGKCHSYSLLRAFQISKHKFLLHMHFKSQNSLDQSNARFKPSIVLTLIANFSRPIKTRGLHRPLYKLKSQTPRDQSKREVYTVHCTNLNCRLLETNQNARFIPSIV